MPRSVRGGKGARTQPQKTYTVARVPTEARTAAMIYAMREKRGDREPEKVASLSLSSSSEKMQYRRPTNSRLGGEKKAPACFRYKSDNLFSPPHPSLPPSPHFSFPITYFYRTASNRKRERERKKEKKPSCCIAFFCESALARVGTGRKIRKRKKKG